MKELKKLHQTKFGFPEGNCFETCLAMLLGREISSIPSYKEDKKWFFQYRDWLRPQGYDMLAVGKWNEDAKPFCPDVFCIAGGKSPRGDFQHAIVYYGNKLYHDPHPDGTGIENIEDYIYLVPILASEKQAK